MKHYTTLYDILKRNYNRETKLQLDSNKYKSTEKAVNVIKIHIENYVIPETGRNIRVDRQQTMVSVMEFLLSYLHRSKTGQVCPSLQTIAYGINKSLEKPKSTDNEFTIKLKEKALHATVMKVQRALKTLESIKMIKIHEYYINEQHALSMKRPCHFYQIFPFSDYSRDFKIKDFTTKLKEQQKEYKQLTLKIEKNRKPESESMKKEKELINYYNKLVQLRKNDPAMFNIHFMYNKEMVKEAEKLVGISFLPALVPKNFYKQREVFEC